MKIAGQASWRIVRRGKPIFWNKWLLRPAPPPEPLAEIVRDEEISAGGAAGEENQS